MILRPRHLAFLFIGLTSLAPGCQGHRRTLLARSAEPEHAPTIALSMPLPEGLADDAAAGFSRGVTVIISNTGEVPVVITALRVDGLAEARRALTVPAEGRAGFLRAFGFLPPGEGVRYRLGVGYPRPGSGEIRLRAELRVLPVGTRGKVMEEILIPARAREGSTHTLLTTTTVSIAPRAFNRQVATARALSASGPAARVRAAAYSRTLGGWVLRMDDGHTLLATPTETRTAGRLSLAAVRLMDHYADAVPVLDGEGRLREIPKGPLLRILIEDSQRRGHAIDVAEYAPGKEALHVE